MRSALPAAVAEGLNLEHHAKICERAVRVLAIVFGKEGQALVVVTGIEPSLSPLQQLRLLFEIASGGRLGVVLIVAR